MARVICGKRRKISMFESKTIKRLNDMLDLAMEGKFCETDYDESKLSQLENKWKHFLGTSAISAENTRIEKDNVKALVTDISHQTKTPMTNIKMYSELLGETIQREEHMDNKEECIKILDAIENQTKKLEFLIQSLTKMSRLESNVFEICPMRQEVSPLIDEVVNDALVKAKERNITLVNEYKGNSLADFDMKWTKEALYNIVDNALKYSKPDSKVTISVMEYEMYLAICVKDLGIGMSEEEIPKIFDRFYRGSHVQQEDGVGIGLYLAREIVKRENGYIKVKSFPQKGSEFQIFLSKL